MLKHTGSPLAAAAEGREAAAAELGADGTPRAPRPRRLLRAAPDLLLTPTRAPGRSAPERNKRESSFETGGFATPAVAGCFGGVCSPESRPRPNRGPRRCWRQREIRPPRPSSGCSPAAGPLPPARGPGGTYRPSAAW